jgi:hypothetical protein
MPRTHRAKCIEREQIEFYTAYALIKDLPDKIRSFESKSDKDIQQLLHEWTYLVHDLVHSLRPGKYDKNRWDALDKMQAIKAGVILRLRNGHGPEYTDQLGEQTRRNISDRMKALFEKTTKLREDDLEQWAACFVDEAADNGSDLDLSPDQTAESLSTHNSQASGICHCPSTSAPNIQKPRAGMGAMGGVPGVSSDFPIGTLASRPLKDHGREGGWKIVRPEASSVFVSGTSSVQADEDSDGSFVLVKDESDTGSDYDTDK